MFGQYSQLNFLPSHATGTSAFLTLDDIPVMQIQIHPSEIGFDIDGVLADTSEAFLRIGKEAYGISNFTNSDITEFEVEKCLPIPKKIVNEIFDYLLKEPINADLRPMPNAIRVLTKMAKKSPVILITARPFKQPINDWLEHVMPPATFGKIKLIAMGDHDGKLTHIRKEKLRYFVDDRRETCLSLHKNGITPIIYTQPWNVGKHNLVTVESWKCIEKKLNI